MITAGGAKFLKDGLLVRPTGALAAVEAGEGLAFGGQTHVRCFGYHQLESTDLERIILTTHPQDHRLFPIP